MFHFKFNHRLGQTIIEGVVALSAIMVVLSALSVATLTSVNNSSFIKNQSLAAKYAQQGIENVRYTRNNYPSIFAGYQSNTYCMGTTWAQDGTPDSGPNAGCSTVNITDSAGASFIREVIFSRNSAYCSGGTQVTVTVRWSTGKCNTSGTTIQRYCHNVKVISCFSDPSSSGSSL